MGKNHLDGVTLVPQVVQDGEMKSPNFCRLTTEINSRRLLRIIHRGILLQLRVGQVQGSRRLLIPTVQSLHFVDNQEIILPLHLPGKNRTDSRKMCAVIGPGVMKDIHEEDPDHSTQLLVKVIVDTDLTSDLVNTDLTSDLLHSFRVTTEKH